jgi:MFS family permease
MEKTSKKKFFSTLIIFSLVGQIAWVVENMYFNVFIHKMFNANEDQIALMVALSAVSATLTTLIVGALSDKLGKRKIFISAGYILWGVSILLFALVRTDIMSALFPVASIATLNAVCITLVIALDCVMTFFGSSANDACFNAWLTDVTTSQNRGSAEGINAMMPLLAILVVFGGFMGFDLGQASSWTAIYIIIGVAVIVIGIIGIFIIDEPKIETSENKSYFKNIIYGFRPSIIKQNKMLYIYLIAFAIFGISIQVFMPYLIIYYEQILGDSYVFVMAPAIILAGVFTFFWGKVYDKVGFAKSIIPSLALLGTGYIILTLFVHMVPVFIGSLLMMCGYLSGMAVFGAIIRDKTPENKSGMFQGLRIVGQVLIPGVIGPAIGAWVLKDAPKKITNDGTEVFVPNESIFIGALVVLAVLAIMLTIIFILAKRKEKTNETK